MNLSENLKRIRKDNNLSQEQLAEKLSVSRQSVSKWESGQAYPEMDKVIQLCKMFDLNIDDLLNQDIKETADNKQAKTNLNKFVEDFFDYITKTVEMFNSLTFKQQIKCLFEQVMIILLLTVIGNIIEIIIKRIVYGLLSFLPTNVYHLIYDLISGVYSLAFLVLGVVIVLHIFKIRYLDYYVKVKTPIKEQPQVTDDTVEAKEEKLVIRDPNHSSYKFMTILFNGFVILSKMFLAFVGLGFSFSLVTLVMISVLSFVIIKTGTLFIGLLLGLISGIIVNLIILTIIYSILVNKKIKKDKLALAFVVTLVLIGTGLALTSLGIAKINYIEKPYAEPNYVEYKKTLKMTDDLVIRSYYYNINYVESNTNDVEIIINHSKFYDFSVEPDINNIYYIKWDSNTSFPIILKENLKDLNESKYINYHDRQITIYASSENIQKLKNNYSDYLAKQQNQDHQDEIDALYETINELNIKINELESENNNY